MRFRPVEEFNTLWCEHTGKHDAHSYKLLVGGGRHKELVEFWCPGRLRNPMQTVHLPPMPDDD